MKFCAACLFIFGWLGQCVNGKIVTIDLCGPESDIELATTGEASSVTVLLNARDHKKSCKLNVVAPESHVVNLQWHEENRELFNYHPSTTTASCPLSIFLPDNNKTAMWTGDPCLHADIPEVDLLTPEFSLIWSPPRNGFQVRGRKLVITAVGQGSVCKTDGHHTCMRIGWEPVLCISDQLVCDGNPNCPKGAPISDEDETLCKSHLIDQASWQQVAEEVIRKLPNGIVNSKWLQDRQKSDGRISEGISIPHITWDTVETTTTAPDHHHHHESEDTVSSALSHYGPWGYLMLGMLICGTILMFCGLWECCFRKPKTHIDIANQHQPTTVLIINRGQEDRITHQPPTYDDLDQPPSYLTLFPSFKAATVVESNESEGESGSNTNEPASPGVNDENHTSLEVVDDNRSVEDVREERSTTLRLVTTV